MTGILLVTGFTTGTKETTSIYSSHTAYFVEREADAVSNEGRTEEQVMQAEERTSEVENKSNDIRTFAKIQIPGHGGAHIHGGTHT